MSTTALQPAESNPGAGRGPGTSPQPHRPVRGEQSRLERTRAWLRRYLYNLRELFLLWMGLVLAQALVPRTHYLADLSLLPWVTLTTSLCLLLRYYPLMPTPHPALSMRKATALALARRLSAVLVPWVLLLWVELAVDLRQDGKLTLELGAATLGATLLLGLGMFYSQQQGLTAWTPTQGGYKRLMSLLCLGAGLPLFLLEPRANPMRDSGLTLGGIWLLPCLVGASFLLASSQLTPARDMAQFVAGQAHHGRPAVRIWLQVLAPLLATWFLPVLGLGALNAFYLERYGDLGFSGAMLHALVICLFTGALYPRAVPVAMACIFHEVRPKGEEEEPEEGKVSDFTASPEGSLVFNPLHVERTRRIHPVLIPVESPQLALFEARVPYLWPLEGVAPQNQLLGHASFEVQGAYPQWQEITVRKASRDLIAWKSQLGFNLQRILILRSFSESWLPIQEVTFDHEETRWEGQVQSMADPGDTLSLRTGDMVVLSVGGSIRAYELEIGAPVYPGDPVAHERLPVLEDFVRVQSGG